MNKSLKRLLITGTDSDSGVIAVLGKIAFGGNIDVVYSGNGIEASRTISRELLEEKGFEKYDEVFITKIAFDRTIDENGNYVLDGIVEVLDGICSVTNCKILYINHQEFNMDLDVKTWARIIPTINDKKVMSADAFMHILKTEYNFKSNDWLDNLVEISRQYGVYEWRESGELLPKRFNDFYISKLPKDFTNNMLEKYYTKRPLLSMQEMEDIYKKEKDYECYLTQKKNEVEVIRISIDNTEFRVGLLESDLYISELGYDIATQIPNLDCAMILTSANDKIRIRRSGNSKVDVSIIARAFGGNGNPATAGAKVTPQVQKKLKKILYSSLLKEYGIKIV